MDDDDDDFCQVCWNVSIGVLVSTKLAGQWAIVSCGVFPGLLGCSWCTGHVRVHSWNQGLYDACYLMHGW